MIQVIWYTDPDHWYVNVHKMAGACDTRLGPLVNTLGPYATRYEAIREGELYVNGEGGDGLSDRAGV